MPAYCPYLFTPFVGFLTNLYVMGLIINNIYIIYYCVSKKESTIFFEYITFILSMPAGRLKLITETFTTSLRMPLPMMGNSSKTRLQ